MLRYHYPSNRIIFRLPDAASVYPSCSILISSSSSANIHMEVARRYIINSDYNKFEFNTKRGWETRGCNKRYQPRFQSSSQPGSCFISCRGAAEYSIKPELTQFTGRQERCPPPDAGSASLLLDFRGRNHCVVRYEFLPSINFRVSRSRISRLPPSTRCCGNNRPEKFVAQIFRKTVICAKKKKNNFALDATKLCAFHVFRRLRSSCCAAGSASATL